MMYFVPLVSAFGRDTAARDIAHNYVGRAWTWQNVLMVLATLRRLHLRYHGPLLNLLPFGVSSLASPVFRGNGTGTRPQVLKTPLAFLPR